MWNWLPRHLIAQGIPESKALNILSLGFALGLLMGRVAVSPILIRVPAVAGDTGGVDRDGGDDVSDAADQQAGHGCGAGFHCGAVDGAGVSHYAGHHGRRRFRR